METFRATGLRHRTIEEMVVKNRGGTLVAFSFNMRIITDRYAAGYLSRWALISMSIKRSFALLVFALLPPFVQAGDPMMGVAAGVALFEACARLSPELAQRYKSWLERPLPELSATVAEARQLPEYAVAKKRIAEAFDKAPKADLVQSCATEFNREWWPK